MQLERWPGEDDLTGAGEDDLTRALTSTLFFARRCDRFVFFLVADNGDEE